MQGETVWEGYGLGAKGAQRCTDPTLKLATEGEI